MIRGSKVKFAGQKDSLTRGREYRIIAGKGDGTPRNDGTLGAAILSDTEFFIHDDFGNIRQCSFKTGQWIVTHVAPAIAPEKPKRRDPVVILRGTRESYYVAR